MLLDPGRSHPEVGVHTQHPHGAHTQEERIYGICWSKAKESANSPLERRPKKGTAVLQWFQRGTEGYGGGGFPFVILFINLIRCPILTLLFRSVAPNLVRRCDLHGMHVSVSN
jgi:hypothetical protein